MNFFLRIVSGLGAELRATVGVYALLKRRFWFFYALLILATLTVAVLPGVFAAVGAGLMVVALGLGGIFSGSVAKRLRAFGWVRFADGPEVVPYLSQAVAILLGPPFFLALMSLFHAAAPYFAALAPAGNWLLALALSIDGFLHTQLFFDFFESFRLRLYPKPEAGWGWQAATLIFVARALLDIAFIKLAVQLIRAAYFRALDFGRGGDPIAQARDAADDDDYGAVRLHSREVGKSVRAAADDLRLHVEAGGKCAEQARLGLRAMKDFAISHFEDKVETQLGDERARTEAFIDELKADDGPEPAAKPVGLLHLVYLALMYVVLAGLTAVAWYAPLETSWALSIGLTALLGWFLIAPRRWLDRFEAWHILPAGSPGWMPFRILLWLAFLTPLFMLTSSEVLVLVARAVPSAFGLSSADQVTGASALAFVAENMLRTQVFVDTVEIYSLKMLDWQQAGLLGGLLTFLLRLTFNIGLLAVLVPFFLEQFNRLFRGLKTRPDAELLLRREARNCGPHAALLVSYYFTQVRDWFVEAMAESQAKPKMLGALAASGFVRDFQARYPEGPKPSEDPAQDVARRLELGQSLIYEGIIEEGEKEIHKAIQTLDTLLETGRTDLDDLEAFARYVAGNLAMVKGQMPEAEVRLREAMAMIERLGGLQVGSPVGGRLADLFDSLAIVVGQSVARAQEALGYSQQSVDLYNRLIADGRADLRADLAGALGTRGRMLNLLQRWDESVESLQKALALLEELHAESEQAAHESLAAVLFSGTGPKKPDARGSLAQQRLELAEVYRELRRFDLAADQARQAVAWLEALVREGQSAQRTQLARALNVLGLVLNDALKHDEAQPHFERAREMCESLILEGHDNQRQLLAPLLNNLGLLLNEKGRHEEAEKHFRRAVELIDRLVAEGQTQRQELLVFVYSNLSIALMRQKRMHEAEAEVNKAVEIAQGLVKAGQATLRDELALVLSNLGDLLTLKFRWEQAVTAFRESAHWYGELAEGGAPQYRPLRARALERLSASLRQFGELDQAEHAGQDAVGLFGLLFNAGGEEHRRDLAGAVRTLGLAYHANRHYDRAVASFREAEQYAASDSPDDRHFRATLLVDTAAAYEAQERHAEAILALDQAIVHLVRLVEGGLSALQAELALLLNHRGNLLYKTDDHDSALTAYREAIRRLKPVVDGGNKAQRENLATLYGNLAATLVQLDEPGWEEAYPAGLHLLGVLVGEGDPGAAEAYHGVADRYAGALYRKGRVADAEQALRQAAGTYAAAAGRDPLNHRARLGEALTRQGLALLLAGERLADAQGEIDATLGLLENLLRLPEPPDKALRLYREAVGSFLDRLIALPALDKALPIVARAVGFYTELEAKGRPDLTAARIDVFRRCSEIHERRGDLDAALDYLQRAWNLTPDDPLEAYGADGPALRLLRLRLDRGRGDEARALVANAIAGLHGVVGDEPDSSYATDVRTLAAWYRERAKLEQADGDAKAAAATLRRAIVLLNVGDADPAVLAATWEELLAVASDAATLAEARTFVSRLGDPDRLPAEAAAVVKRLAERAG